MNNPAKQREALEDLWSVRLHEAQRQYRFAKGICTEASRECTNGHLPMSDGNLAFRQALLSENAALAEYLRVLRIFSDLTVRGKLPPVE